MMLIDVADLEFINFPRPQFYFGQLVKTEADGTGYIIGMHFYLEVGSWLYSLYIIERQATEEFWYEAKELKLLELEAKSVRC